MTWKASLAIVTVTLGLLFASVAPLTDAYTVTLIRHAEKAKKTDPSPNSLAGEGFERAQCLARKFTSSDATSPFRRPTYIFAMAPRLYNSTEAENAKPKIKKDGTIKMPKEPRNFATTDDLTNPSNYVRVRPFLTVQPLANALALPPVPPNVVQATFGSNNVDVSVDRERIDLLVARVKAEGARAGPDGNVLVCWQHGNLNLILAALGLPGQTWDKKDYDSMWSIDMDTMKFVQMSQGCNGLYSKKGKKHGGRNGPSAQADSALNGATVSSVPGISLAGASVLAMSAVAIFL